MEIEQWIKSGMTPQSPVMEGENVLFRYDGKAEKVYLVGDYNRWEQEDRMKKAKDRDVWYIAKRFPENARFDYKFVVDGNWITDPLNPHRTPGGAGDNSTLIMPRYHSDYDRIIREEVPRGAVLRDFWCRSRYLDVDMRYHVYLPYGYTKEKTTHLVYALDGSDYLNFSQAERVFDYLIHKGEMPPAVVILADPHERTMEYTLYEPHYRYFHEELMPRVEKEYTNPEAIVDRAVMGVSWGGLTAIYLAVESTRIFHRILSQSGSFWPREWLIFGLIKKSDISHLRCCLQTGTIEDTEEMNDVMAEILKKKGCRVHYAKYAESHSWGNWKGHLDEGLRQLYRM